MFFVIVEKLHIPPLPCLLVFLRLQDLQQSTNITHVIVVDATLERTLLHVVKLMVVNGDETFH